MHHDTFAHAGMPHTHMMIFWIRNFRTLDVADTATDAKQPDSYGLSHDLDVKYANIFYCPYGWLERSIWQ
jgi:hypothetical protein